MKNEQPAITMNHKQVRVKLERQQLIKEAHSLVAAIASKPGSTKLLRAVVQTLRLYAAYKTNRRRQWQRGG